MSDGKETSHILSIEYRLVLIFGDWHISGATCNSDPRQMGWSSYIFSICCFYSLISMIWKNETFYFSGDVDTDY